MALYYQVVKRRLRSYRRNRKRTVQEKAARDSPVSAIQRERIEICFTKTITNNRRLINGVWAIAIRIPINNGIAISAKCLASTITARRQKLRTKIVHASIELRMADRC